MTNTFSVWLLAARLRTLPLACSSILLGSGLAASRGAFDGTIMGLSLLTAILLQILSNLANDYGDAVSGADNGERIGPQRAVVSGLITRHQMCVAMGLTALAAVVSGLSLLVCAFGEAWQQILTFILLGERPSSRPSPTRWARAPTAIAASGTSRCSCSSACWGARLLLPLHP